MHFLQIALGIAAVMPAGSFWRGKFGRAFERKARPSEPFWGFKQALVNLLRGNGACRLGEGERGNALN